MAARGKYSKEMCEEAERLAGELRQYKDIAASLGISNDTFWRYMKDKPDFSEAIKRGKERWKSAIEFQCLNRIAQDDSWQSQAWILERVFPDQYGKLDRLQATIGGGMDNTITITVEGDEWQR